MYIGHINFVFINKNNYVNTNVYVVCDELLTALIT